jgi:ribulose-5-phosphate 4-epimerase/fuculose-1-phosphate aldolase
VSKPEHIGPVEWQARCELAALYRLVAHFRMTDLIDTHITLRIPGPEHHFLINRYGVIFDRMRASDLVRIDQDGRVVDPEYEGHRVNAAGFVIHSAIHMARPDLNCVIHTHTAAGMAVAAQKQGLSLDERERLIADLGPHRAMILRNHGLLVGGSGVAQAFQEIHFLERACQAQVAALSGGSALHYPSPEVCAHTAEQFDRDEQDNIIDLAWEAALTLIESQRESYLS